MRRDNSFNSRAKTHSRQVAGDSAGTRGRTTAVAPCGSSNSTAGQGAAPLSGVTVLTERG